MLYNWLAPDIIDTPMNLGISLIRPTADSKKVLLPLATLIVSASDIYLGIEDPLGSSPLAILAKDSSKAVMLVTLYYGLVEPLLEFIALAKNKFILLEDIKSTPIVDSGN